MNAPARLVACADAFGWLDAHPAEPGTSVITSLPDVSELPELALEEWRRWFVATTRRIVRWLPAGGVAIFYQSDVRQRGVWVDKGYLVLRAADDEDASIVWHKIVCRKPAGTETYGRASYSHMIAIAREERPPPRTASADVLPDLGEMTWSRGIGVAACKVACRYLRDETDTRIVVDPFCGRGTVLAVANAFGLDAIGVEVAKKRCQAARGLVLDVSI